LNNLHLICHILFLLGGWFPPMFGRGNLPLSLEGPDDEG
jgi:hypothetical protein